MAELNFNASEVEPNAPLEPVPPGDYPVMIVQSEMRPTKSGDGKYLWMEMDILDGDYKGRKLWDRLNLVNPNQQAVDIAQRTLSAICHAVGVMQVQDSEQLHGHALIASVKTRPAKGEYPAGNDIKGYKPMDGQTPQPQTAPAEKPAQQAQPAGAAAGSGKPPWQRS